MVFLARILANRLSLYVYTSVYKAAMRKCGGAWRELLRNVVAQTDERAAYIKGGEGGECFTRRQAKINRLLKTGRKSSQSPVSDLVSQPYQQQNAHAHTHVTLGVRGRTQMIR